MEAQSRLSLSELNAKRIRLTTELRNLNEREEKLQALAVINGGESIGAQQQLNQVLMELEEVQREQARVEAELATVTQAQTNVTAQSAGNNVLQASELTTLQARIREKQAELDALITERNNINQQVFVDGNVENGNAIVTDRLLELNQEIRVKIDELESLSTQLSNLANRVSSQGNTENNTADPAALRLEASRLEAEISDKESRLVTINKQIQDLQDNSTDVISLQQIQELEGQKREIETELRTERDQLARIQAQLRSN